MKKIIPVVVIFIFFSSFIQSIHASPLNQTQYDLKIDTQKFILDNGMTVLVSDMPNSSVVSFYMVVKAGSVNEGKFLGAGISHFIEHMIFKGTEKRGVGVIANEIQSLGGVINAGTDLDFTIYTITVPLDAFDQALDVLADMMMHPRFDAQEMEKEREVILGEMRLHEDRPERYLSQKVFDTIYTQHPYRLPVIGYKNLFLKLRREDLLEYYQKYYTPNNMVFSIAGHISGEKILPKIKDIFKTFEREPYMLRNMAAEPPQGSARRYEGEYPTDLTRMSFSFSGVSLSDHDLFAMDVLAAILGQGESSRLYKELFQKRKLVHSISASNFSPIDRGIFEIECVLDEKNIDQVIQAIKEQINAIKQKELNPAELEKIKQLMLNQYVIDRQTSASVAEEVATHEAFIGDFDFAKKYLEAIHKITVKDIQYIANKYFTDQTLSIVILKSKHDQETQTLAQEEKPSPEIKKFVLPNGLTILLREDHSRPLINLHLVLNGGSEQEPEGLNGVSELTAHTWVKGRRSRNHELLTEAIESRGGTMYGFSGRDSFGVHLQLLSGYTDFALELIEDLIKNPLFEEKELQNEKEKMKTGIIAEQDNIHLSTAKELRKLLFQTHPFRFYDLVTLDSVDRITLDDIKNFYKRFCSPNHMVLTVLGDFSSTQVMNVLKKIFAGLKPKDLVVPSFRESPPEASREKTIYLDKEQAMVMIGFQGVDVLSEDYYATEVLAAILGSPFSGKIFTQVRDVAGQAYNLGGGVIASRDAGMMAFHVLTTRENIEKVKETLMTVIKDIRSHGVDDTELKNIKSYLKGKFQRGIETDHALSVVVGLDELQGLGYDHYQHYAEHIDQVTSQDIERVAATYLDPQKSVSVLCLPKIKKP